MNKIFSPKIIIFFIFFIIVSLVYMLSFNFFENRFNDFLTKVLVHIQNKKVSDDIVLVVIDDKSLDNINWPWSRDLFNDLFDFLEHDSGAKVVVFQNLVVFPDTYNPDKDDIFYNRILNNKKLINSFILLNSNMAGDVLPSEYLKLFEEKSIINITDKRTKYFSSLYKGVIKLPKKFLENVRFLGSSIIPEDNDEIVRNYMPVVQLRDKLYPSLALSAFALYKDMYNFTLYDNYLCSDDDCKTLKMPVFTKKGRDYIGNSINGIFSYYDWYKPNSKYYSHKTYSAIDILVSYYAIHSGNIPKINPVEFKDKIVIIGLNADKNVWDQLSETPVLKRQADIDVHAVILDNMLSNSFKSVNKIDYTLFITIIFCFFIIRGFKNFKNNFVFTSILAMLYLVYYVYEYFNEVYIPVITPIIAMYCCTIFKEIFLVITTDKTSEMIKQAMGKYVSKDVMKKVIMNLDKLKLGGTRTVVTILFVDIRNFTQISENLSPQEVSSILNEYFSTIEPVIAKYHGIINKYIGDGALAVFGEPIQNEQHALNAIKCGQEIVEKVKLLREKFIAEGKPKISIGIGINTGEVFAGNIGTEERLEYTVIGDNVNLASRIEAYNQILKTQFLISEYTFEYVKNNVEVVKLSQFNIKGKSKPIDIYEVLRIKNDD